ncbi:MAG TPA: helix-hairpin-helix domain-containing protein [candidate division Zixibacteria bacterium]|nr:helix-hairpin-helix domain-containing protein [candidate division Zixibacteria bacterium]
MNQYFDFTSRQLKCLSVLCATAMIMGGYLFVRSFARPADQVPPFSVFIGENEEKFTGMFVLDPNTAPADSLELLPGIGRVLADRIVEYRQQYPFHREIDITEVKGIGPRLYERLKPYLKVTSY